MNEMAKPKIDEVREERIAMEAVVDCYNEAERFAGWFYYLEGKLEFPFRARCIKRHGVSPLNKGEDVEVIGMLDEDWDNASEIFVEIKWRDCEFGVPLVQLEGVEISGQAAEAIADWHYWCAHGYCF